jgi:hypothetical protein
MAEGGTHKTLAQKFRDAIYYSDQGWAGQTTLGYRNSMISACLGGGYPRGKVAGGVFVEPDGNDAELGTPLVRITKGKPRMIIQGVILHHRQLHRRVRALWEDGWEAELRVSFDPGIIGSGDIHQLLCRAGMLVGIGEGRPDSRDSHGCPRGTFAVSNPTIIERE